MSFSAQIVATKVSAVAPSDAKVTDTTPGTSYEEVKAITVTPASGGRVTLKQVQVDVAANITALLGTRTLHVGYSVEDAGAAPKTTPDAAIGTRAYNSGTFGHCTSNNFATIQVPLDVAGALNVGKIVRFWTRHDGGGTGTTEDLCVRNARVTYDERGPRGSMVRQTWATHRRQMG